MGETMSRENTRKKRPACKQGRHKAESTEEIRLQSEETRQQEWKD